jgi:hypothetical protein
MTSISLPPQLNDIIYFRTDVGEFYARVAEINNEILRIVDIECIKLSKRSSLSLARFLEDGTISHLIAGLRVVKR